MSQDQISFQSDCSKCASLCCFAYAFTEGVEFPIDKDADELCPHIGEQSGCDIHPEREAAGFSGCIKYDCLGAGQRVVQEVFQGKSWRDDPALLQPMGQGLRVMKIVHQQLQLLETVSRLPLTVEEKVRHDALVAQAGTDVSFSPDGLAAFPVNQFKRDVSDFLKGLAHHFPKPAES